MRLLFVTPEAYPLAKTGGLGDVGGALPLALTAIGVEVRTLMPAYRGVLDRVSHKKKIASFGDPFGVGEASLVEGRCKQSGLRVWLIDCPALYDRDGGPYQQTNGADWPDNDIRFALLGWVGARLCHDSSPLPFRPDVAHLHDWQAGLVPAYLAAWDGVSWKATSPKIVTTIHNIAYQGMFWPGTMERVRLPRTLLTVDQIEFWGHVSYLKAGLALADRITTVSPTYAREIQTAVQGAGMEGLLSHRAADLSGILNGADYANWSPHTDKAPVRPYGAADVVAGKAANKAALQRELGLPQKPDAPLFFVVSRLNLHKGMDMVLAALPSLLAGGGQLAVLGTGDKPIEDAFRAVRHPSVAVRIGYSEELAHRMQAGGDLLLMPSRSEPCGLTQLYAYRYGTLPLVHRVGGLADTVVDARYDTMLDGSASGFVFDQANPIALTACIERAIATYRQTAQWRKLQASALALDFSWERAARDYLALYQQVTS